MPKNKNEHYVEGLCETIGVCETPGEGGESKEEGEQICEGWVGSVVCLCCLFLQSHQRCIGDVGAYIVAYVVEYLAKHLLGRYYQAHNLPCGHLKVHLRELEHALEEARHLDFVAPRRGH